MTSHHNGMNDLRRALERFSQGFATAEGSGGTDSTIPAHYEPTPLLLSERAFQERFGGKEGYTLSRAVESQAYNGGIPEPLYRVYCDPRLRETLDSM